MTDAQRTALVTGGGRGIGAAICRSLAEAGHRVIVADLDPTNASEVAKDLGGIAVEMDVTDNRSVVAAFAEAARLVGTPDILVNNAGWDELMPFLETDEIFAEKVVQINYHGVVRTVRAALPGMVDKGWGRIVNIASDAGRVGSTHEAVYSGAKGGVIAFSKTIAREFARHGITVNSVCPGPTETPLLKTILDASEDSDHVINSIRRTIPMRRLGRPSDLGPAVVFFASEGAGFVTGQTLSVSGGLTMA